MVVRRTVLSLAVAASLLAGCSDDSDTATEDADLVPGVEATEGEEAVEGEEATDEEEAAGDGAACATDPNATLRWGYYVNLTRFDPHRATSSFDNTYLYPVYDRLVHVTPEGDPEPGLATEWEFNEDGSVLEMTLREGVTFHDGEPFNAEAVKANIERAKTVEGSAVAGDLSIVDTVEVVDDTHVRFNLTGPGASLPLVLSDRAGMMISPAAFDNPDLDTAPVGAGMFRVTGYQPSNVATYERFDEYWDPEAVDLAGLEIRYMADSATRLNALQSGQIDATHIDPNQLQQAEQAGLETIVEDTLSFVHLQMNRTRSEFDDPLVRQAINHAINREAIVQALLFGEGSPAIQNFPEGYVAHDPEISPDIYEYNPERARELLAEAGLADGFSFEIITAVTPLRVQAAEAVQQQLAEVGIDVTLRQVEPAQVSEIFYSAQQGDSILAAWGGRPDPSQTAGLLYTPGNLPNPGGHTTPEVQAAYDASLIPGDGRPEALKELSALITEQSLDVPLYFPNEIFVSQEPVEGLDVWIGGKPEFRNVGMCTA